MKKVVLIAFTILATLGYSSAKSQEIYQGRVIRVVDGDTFDINLNGRLQRIRLSVADAPELSPLQPGGLEAKQYLHNRIANRNITIKKDGTNGSRMVAVVKGPDQYSLNWHMIRDGYAMVDPRFVTSQNRTLYFNAQNSARSYRKGIWSATTPVIAPRNWRAGVRNVGQTLPANLSTRSQLGGLGMSGVPSVPSLPSLPRLPSLPALPSFPQFHSGGGFTPVYPTPSQGGNRYPFQNNGVGKGQWQQGFNSPASRLPNFRN